MSGAKGPSTWLGFAFRPRASVSRGAFLVLPVYARRGRRGWSKAAIYLELTILDEHGRYALEEAAPRIVVQARALFGAGTIRTEGGDSLSRGSRSRWDIPSGKGIFTHEGNMLSHSTVIKEES